MSTIIAYLLVVPLVQFCLTMGVLILGFAIALVLAWAPVALRLSISCVFGGVGGVATAVGFGYGVFRIVVGPDSFTLGAFLASTVPLFIPIWNDIKQARRHAAARSKLLDAFEKSEADKLAYVTEESGGGWSPVVGEIVGLIAAAAWFFGRS